MKPMAYLRSLGARILRPSRVEADLDDELRLHMQLRADDLERSGMDRTEAERRAGIEFGGRERFREETREALGGNLLDTAIKDIRFGLRVLRKSPGFTLAAIFTLALAIGANALVFGVLNALVLRPLNVPDAQSLYQIERPVNFAVASYPDYIDMRDQNRSFETLMAYNVTQAGLDTGGEATSAYCYEVSGNYFDGLKIEPFLGRFFHAADEHGPNSAPYIVLTYAYWEAHFLRDTGVVGRVVRLNKHPYTVIGVAPRDFNGTVLFFSPDIFVPLVDEEQVEGASHLQQRSWRWIYATMGHLKPGVTPAQAVADLNSIGAYLEKTYPKEDGLMKFTLTRPSLAGNFLGPGVRAFVTGLSVLAALILLAACANLGSLFAARAADRSREVALRLALGASRSRILRQLLTEAMLISAAGGAIGLWGSIALLNALSAWQPFHRFPIRVPVAPDASVYVMALALALVSGFLFGLVPVRQVMRVDANQVLKAGSTAAHGRRVSMRDALLVVQIAICAVLVTSSFVALRGLVRSLHGEYGFEPRNVMVVNTDLNMAGYSGDRVNEMQKRMTDAMAAIPGVESAALVSTPPLDMGVSSGSVFKDETTDLRAANAATSALIYNISPGYFRTAQTRLLRGRDISSHDDKNAPLVAVVNREFARLVFGSVEKATGGYFKRPVGPNGTRFQVAGVVEDGKYVTLTEDQRAAVFFPIEQAPSNSTWLAVRASGDATQLGGAIRAAMRNLDAGLPVYIQTWVSEMDVVLFPARIATLALAVLGMMGAMLAITGIFGMAAYSVSRRLKELGIRMAIGARRGEVLRAAIGRALKLLTLGSAAGLILGMLATRVLASVVYQATPRDPLVLAGVVAAMALVGLIATWIPAQRALSLDPITLLREE